MTAPQRLSPSVAVDLALTRTRRLVDAEWRQLTDEVAWDRDVSDAEAVAIVSIVRAAAERKRLAQRPKAPVLRLCQDIDERAAGYYRCGRPTTTTAGRCMNRVWHAGLACHLHNKATR